VTHPLHKGLLGLALAGVLLAPAASAAAQDTTMPLNTSNDSGASGQAMIHAMGGSTMIMITVNGLEPNSRHAAHIHNGSCTAGILLPLEVVVADANGVGTSNTTLPQAADATWWIQVHRAEAPPGPGIVCGAVQGS
jgi:Cu/Zn superoxide dismutase